MQVENFWTIKPPIVQAYPLGQIATILMNLAVPSCMRSSQFGLFTVSIPFGLGTEQAMGPCSSIQSFFEDCVQCREGGV